MLIIRPLQAFTRYGVKTRMKPAKATISTPRARRPASIVTFKCFAVFAECAVVNRDGVDAGIARAFKAKSVGIVGDDDDDLITGFSALRVEQGLQIGAAAGDEDADVSSCRDEAANLRTRARPLQSKLC